VRESGDIRGLQLTLVIYIVAFAMKLVAYSLSGVMALLAESLHTLSDIFISDFLLFATYYSRKRADHVHMFDHGRAQNVAPWSRRPSSSLSPATSSTRSPFRASCGLAWRPIRTWGWRWG
jgi:Cation efflux family